MSTLSTSTWAVSERGVKPCQDVRDYARQKGLADQSAITVGLEEKAREFRAAGSKVYQET